MTMTEQIRQIIDLDRQADQIRQAAQDRADQIEADTVAEIRNRRREVLEETKITAKRDYQIEVNHALEIKADTISQASRYLNRQRQEYDAKKEMWADQILKQLFEAAI